MEEGDGPFRIAVVTRDGAWSLKTQNFISVAVIVLGIALIFYFGRNGIFREMAQSPDLFAVIAIMGVVNSVLAISLAPRVRVFIIRHRKRIFKIGIAMLLFFLLSPFALLCIVIPLNITVNLPDHYLDAILWGDFGFAFAGMLIAMIPAHVKFFEYLRESRRR
jgi:hypothetical protein